MLSDHNNHNEHVHLLYTFEAVRERVLINELARFQRPLQLATLHHLISDESWLSEFLANHFSLSTERAECQTIQNEAEAALLER